MRTGDVVRNVERLGRENEGSIPNPSFHDIPPVTDANFTEVGANTLQTLHHQRHQLEEVYFA